MCKGVKGRSGAPKNKIEIIVKTIQTQLKNTIMRWLFSLCCFCAKRSSVPVPAPVPTAIKTPILEPQIKWEDTVPFTFPIYGGQVIKVYDGDTITIASKLPYDASPLYRFSVRLNGLDTPEIKGKDITEEEKEAAKLAREFVENLIMNKIVTLKNVQNEKYGRILADVYIGDINLNELLLKERYAVPYDGGTKKKPSSWLKYRITGEM